MKNLTHTCPSCHGRGTSRHVNLVSHELTKPICISCKGVGRVTEDHCIHLVDDWRGVAEKYRNSSGITILVPDNYYQSKQHH